MGNAQARRAELYGLLGDLPARDRAIAVKSAAVEERDGYVLEQLTLDLNGIEDVPAYFCRPREVSGRLPAVLYNHSHGGNYALGKDELTASRRYLQAEPYAVELTRAGYCVLAIDHWCFGGRNHTSELDTFKLMLWRGQVLWGMMVYDSLRALDYLLSRPEVDAARVATLGMSMGSTMAWWLAALDERIKVCLDLYCLTDFDALVAEKGLARHGVYYYVPGLLKHFSTGEINELIVPRPHLSIAGTRDSLTPVAGLDRVERELKAAYERAGVAERFKLVRYDVGHEETAAARADVMGFLRRYL